MKSIDLSFVLPIYNVEQYLNECVESIRTQLNESVCEIILVDDGSTDSSGIICDEYNRKYEYIKVIHKKNEGLASARNAGLEQVRGKYVAFVDSDDKIASGCIENILSWIKQTNVDVCFMQANKLYADGTLEDLGEHIERAHVYKKPPESVVQYLSTRPKYPGSAWCKIYQYDFLVREKLKFPNDNRRSEDLGFSLDCIMRAESFDVLEMPYYEYRQGRVGSITNQEVTEKGFWDLSKFISESVEKLTNGNIPKGDKCRYALSFVAYEYIQLVSGYSKLNQKSKEKALEFLKEYHWIINFSNSKKTKGVAIVAKIMGIRFTSIILNAYLRTARK